MDESGKCYISGHDANYARAVPMLTSRSCGLPYSSVQYLWNVAYHQWRNNRHASRVARPKASGVAEHSPCPFEAGSARKSRCTVLRVGNKIQCSADAEQSGSGEFVETARREDF